MISDHQFIDQTKVHLSNKEIDCAVLKERYWKQRSIVYGLFGQTMI